MRGVEQRMRRGAAVTMLGGVLVAGLVPAASAAPTAETTASRTVTVASVTDGDTFDTASGDTVRVLGIDSCETSTPGGTNAQEQARQLLQGQTITLRQEPGVGTDPYDRQLRYVTLPGGADYGLTMVAEDHTGIYDGNNDASPEYLEKLRNQNQGRSC